DDELRGIADEIRQHGAQSSGCTRHLERRHRLDCQLHLNRLESRAYPRYHGVQHLGEIGSRSLGWNRAGTGELEKRLDGLIRALQLALDRIEMRCELGTRTMAPRDRQYLQRDRTQRISQVMRNTAGKCLELGIALA